MSLVVLRSWSDGKPPVVREIAKDSNDDSQIIVVPDHQGTFVTKEVEKDSGPTVVAKENPVKPRTWNQNMNRSRSASGDQHQQQQYNGHGHEPAGLGSGTTSPTATLSKRQLSRESSTISNNEGSLGSSGTPPSSPTLNLSHRYKNLGPELAATIPRRHILRNSWIRHDDHENDDQHFKSSGDPEY